MLRTFYRAQELDMEQLKAVYRQTNYEQGRKRFLREEPDDALRLAEEDFERYITEEFYRFPNAFYAVWEEAGQYRCALRMEPYRDGYLLTSLETHPDHRRRGYGTLLIQATSAAVNASVYAHIYKDNKISMAVHEKCGFCQELDYAKLLDGTVTQRACTMRLEPQELSHGG